MQNLKKIVKKILIDLEMSDTDLAEVIGMTKANLSYHFNKADISPKLYQEIIDALVVKKGLNPEISPSQSYTVHDKSFHKNTEGEGMHGNFIGEPKEYNNYNGITSTTLERVIKPYEDLIEMLKLQLAEKERRIKELEEQLIQNTKT
jgi:hypothetical protein